MLPSGIHIFSLMQSTVAVLAIASLAILVVMHHRRDAHLLTQTQEEAILIGAFGLFWFAILVGIRAMNQTPDMSLYAGGHGSNSVAGSNAIAETASRSVGGGVPGREGRNGAKVPGRRAYPCDKDSVYCVVEEWYY
ncbi:hypothetical protein C8Q75DRAFT_741781 [Abortiporus biennis]|nr:hypothetical protein C8Q75DRAFT_741781 [Abortiporus biennis]